MIGRAESANEQMLGVNRQRRALEATNQDLLRANQELTLENAEQRSANEELLVGSGELQAATEEVETLNEELQAANEELETLNEELQATVEELNTTNDYLEARSMELEAAAVTHEEQRRQSQRGHARLSRYLLDGSRGLLVVGSEGEVILSNEKWISFSVQANFREACDDGPSGSLEDVAAEFIAEAAGAGVVSWISRRAARAADGSTFDWSASR